MLVLNDKEFQHSFNFIFSISLSIFICLQHKICKLMRFSFSRLLNDYFGIFNYDKIFNYSPLIFLYILQIFFIFMKYLKIIELLVFSM